MPKPVIFRGIIEEAPVHCSAPPLQFSIPRLSRDAEAVTRPRSPLLPAKWEESSESGAVVEFGVDEADEAEVKVEAEVVAEEPVEAGAEARRVCAQFSAISIAPPAPAASRPRGPGRPKGSTSKPRVEPRFDRSAPPERVEARRALAKMTAKK